MELGVRTPKQHRQRLHARRALGVHRSGVGAHVQLNRQPEAPATWRGLLCVYCPIPAESGVPVSFATSPSTSARTAAEAATVSARTHPNVTTSNGVAAAIMPPRAVRNTVSTLCARSFAYALMPAPQLVVIFRMVIVRSPITYSAVSGVVSARNSTENASVVPFMKQPTASDMTRTFLSNASTGTLCDDPPRRGAVMSEVGLVKSPRRICNPMKLTVAPAMVNTGTYTVTRAA